MMRNGFRFVIVTQLVYGTLGSRANSAFENYIIIVYVGLLHWRNVQLGFGNFPSIMRI